MCGGLLGRKRGSPLKLWQIVDFARGLCKYCGDMGGTGETVRETGGTHTSGDQYQSVWSPTRQRVLMHRFQMEGLEKTPTS